MISGYFYGPVIIERPNGLLVFSSGGNEEDGKLFRSIIRRDVSNKPVIALFYDHAHYAKGARTLLDGDEAMVVAHPDSKPHRAAIGLPREPLHSRAAAGAGRPRQHPLRHRPAGQGAGCQPGWRLALGLRPSCTPRSR
jgi:hypothetical protein